MNSAVKYLLWLTVISGLGLLLAFLLGYQATGTIAGSAAFLVIGAALAMLEVSLSFDNAIVNASKLRVMTPKWRRRFLVWGILIAVFGMRILLPLIIVAVAAGISPVQAFVLATTDPQKYDSLLGVAHTSISAFGGTFLMMVALRYFIDHEKEVDWVRSIETKLRAWSRLRGVEVAIVLVAALAFTLCLPGDESSKFLFASVCGLLVFLGVELLSQLLIATDEARTMSVSGGFAAFIYLEILDASFSFDGVIGAFALTQNLFLVAIGLGIGALFVRSMTVMLVERGTLAQFRYLEHGAFYSILTLSIVMFAQSLWHIPEVLTGLLGPALIGLALVSSIRHSRKYDE